MKKIINLTVSVALMIAAGVFSINTKAVTTGAGSGQNSSVNTLEEVNDLLTSIEHIQANLLMKSEPTTVACTSEYDVNQETEHFSHTSVTFKEITESSSSKSIRENNSNEKVSQTENTDSFASLNRNLTAYFTDNQVYYVSIGNIISKSKAHNYISYKDSSYSYNTDYESYMSLKFNMELYLSTDKAMFKMNEWDAIYYYRLYTKKTDYQGDATETLTEKNTKDYFTAEFDDILGKWVDCSEIPEFVQELTKVNNYNVDFLSNLGEFLTEYIDNNKLFTKSDNIYTMSKEEMLDMFSISSSYDDKCSGGIIIDLSDEKKPTVNAEFSASIKEDKDSLSVYLNDKMIFEKIDNTVINCKIKNPIDGSEWIKKYDKEDD
ncbi:MAG: hypothetical protein ACI4L9_00110 [Candidatus Coproplasma sp.]